jgi:hypothetical protein
MGFLDSLLSSIKNTADTKSGIIDSGRNKNDGGHDHRTNKGKDRTPSQQESDKAKRKP